jgi:hypothetical protein
MAVATFACAVVTRMDGRVRERVHGD